MEKGLILHHESHMAVGSLTVPVLSFVPAAARRLRCVFTRGNFFCALASSSPKVKARVSTRSSSERRSCLLMGVASGVAMLN